MTPSMWIISEDATDFSVLQQLFIQKGLGVILRQMSLSGGSGGISRLAQQLPKLIRAIKTHKRWQEHDCIVVIHDLDAQTLNRHKAQYEQIEATCQRENVTHLVADDKIEAWMLSDGGLCTFLQTAPKNWDANPSVKEALESLLRKKKMVYQGRDRDILIRTLDGTGDNLSPSMRTAFSQLKTLPCVQEPTSL